MFVLVWVSCLLYVNHIQAQYVAHLYESQIPTFVSQNPYFSNIPQFYLNDYYQPQYIGYNIQQQFREEAEESVREKNLNNVNQTETLDYSSNNQADVNSILTNFELPKISALPSDNYRGFGYHTKYGEGSSSTVVFFTGPSVYSKENPQNILKRITVASDSLDPQLPQLKQRLSNIFDSQPKETHSENLQFHFPSYPLVRSLIEHSPFLSNMFRLYNEPALEFNVKQSRNLNVEQVTNINNNTDHPIQTSPANETNETTTVTTIQPNTEYTSEFTTITTAENDSAQESITTEKN